MNAYRIACFTLGASFAVYSLWRGWDAHAAEAVRTRMFIRRETRALKLATYADHERMRQP